MSGTFGCPILLRPSVSAQHLHPRLSSTPMLVISCSLWGETTLSLRYISLRWPCSCPYLHTSHRSVPNATVYVSQPGLQLAPCPLSGLIHSKSSLKLLSRFSCLCVWVCGSGINTWLTLLRCVVCLLLQYNLPGCFAASRNINTYGPCICLLPGVAEHIINQPDVSRWWRQFTPSMYKLVQNI